MVDFDLARIIHHTRGAFASATSTGGIRSTNSEFYHLNGLQLKKGANSSKSNPSTAPEIQSSSRKKQGRAIVCQSCKQVITRSENRTTVGGKHEHTCVNPHGVVFHIGCFDSASGCITQGNRFAHWSWFPGYQWQVILCSSCGVHIGWLFQGDGSSFFGLILARIREQEE